MPARDANERRMIATIAVYESWARTEDRSARAMHGQRALDEKFATQVDPDGVLPPAERAKRAEAAKKAHFTRLALLSAQARRRKAA